MTFLELRTELFARGVDYLNQDAAGTTRAKRWLNEAYIEDVCDEQPWPFLETTVTGTAPLSIADVKDVLYVVDTTNKTRLSSTDIRDVVDVDTDPLTAGTPHSYYLNGASSLAVYPTNTTVSLSVRYVKVPAELSADGDVPVLPARFHPMIVDGAMVRAYRDNDEWEAAGQAQQAFDARLGRMTDAMFSRSFDDSQFVQRLGEHDG